MKIIRNKVIIGILCILTGLAVGFVLLPKARERQESKVEAVRVRQDVPAGTKLDLSMMEVVRAPERAVPAGSIAPAESFLSQYAALPMKAGDYLTPAKVRPTLADPVAAAASKGKQLVTVTLPNFAASAAGLLEPGDVVAVMYTTQESQVSQLGLNPTVYAYQPNGNGAPEDAEPGAGESESDSGTGEPDSGTGEADVPPDESPGNAQAATGYVYQPTYQTTRSVKKTSVPEELRYLEVCKVSSSDGTDAVVNAAKDPEQANRLPSTVTFYATESQALKLAEIEQNGKLHLAFLARGKDADVFIPASERVLAEAQAETRAETEKAVQSQPTPETEQPRESPQSPTSAPTPTPLTATIVPAPETNAPGGEGASE